MKKVKKRGYSKRPIIRITGDHLDLTDIGLSLLALVIDIGILISIWVVK
jgi:hypothetical protein